jgi:AraC-like DNA-binding protein
VLVELDLLVSLFKPNYMQFEEVIKENISLNLSVRELALLCNMSLSSFKRKFAELYIITPIKYFKKLKLEKACDLLKDLDIQISNIAPEVGIYSLTTFNRSFKSYYGKSPSQFRMDETS